MSNIKKKTNNWFNLSIPVVMKIAVASLGNFHAKPFGPELQVNQMLGGRLRRGRVINKKITLLFQ